LPLAGSLVVVVAAAASPQLTNGRGYAVQLVLQALHAAARTAAAVLKWCPRAMGLA
jgi:hypothetical protein